MRRWVSALCACLGLLHCKSEALKGREATHDAGTSGPAQADASAPASSVPVALSREARARLTSVTVSAHVGSVIARKEGGSWVMSGKDGCTVPLARMERALDNLSQITAEATQESVPEGPAFELQIGAFIEGERAVYLEIADRNAKGDLARLARDSMVRIQGLDRALWSPHPADWCRPL